MQLIFKELKKQKNDKNIMQKSQKNVRFKKINLGY